MARRQTGGDPRIALIDKVEVIPFRFWSRSGFSLRGGIEWGGGLRRTCRKFCTRLTSPPGLISAGAFV